MRTKKQSIVERKASRTAMLAAIHRFIAFKEEVSNFRGPDYLSNLFLPSKARFLLSFSFIRRAIRKKMRRKIPGMYEYVTARTRHFDTLFERALQDEVLQIVFLGAGYDTRVIRFKHAIGRTKIFELDVPTTQSEKKALLQKHRIDIPMQLSFVPIDFNKENVEEVLPKAGYDRSLKTFFIWEGVSMYLTEKAVKETMAFVKNNSGQGSSIAFDYFHKAAVEGRSDRYGAKETYKSVIKTGEPYQFGIEEGKLESFLSECDFEILSHCTPEEFEKAYLYDENGAFFGKVCAFICNAHIRPKS